MQTTLAWWFFPLLAFVSSALLARYCCRRWAISHQRIWRPSPECAPASSSESQSSQAAADSPAEEAPNPEILKLPAGGKNHPRTPHLPGDRWAFLLCGLVSLSSVGMAASLIRDVRQERRESTEHERLIDEARKRQVVNEATLLLQQEQALRQAEELARRLKTLAGE